MNNYSSYSSAKCEFIDFCETRMLVENHNVTEEILTLLWKLYKEKYYEYCSKNGLMACSYKDI